MARIIGALPRARITAARGRQRTSPRRHPPWIWGHLRTALAFHAVERIDRFATMDEAQPHAARELGVPV
jgi:hypothetical protein